MGEAADEAGTVKVQAQQIGVGLFQFLRLLLSRPTSLRFSIASAV